MAIRTGRLTGLTGLAALAVLAAACGGGGDGDGDGPALSARPAQEKISLSSADAAAPFALQAGRYKFGWDASECAGVDFTMTGATKGFTYQKTSLQRKFSAIVSEVPEDTYTLTQADPACTTWTVQLDRIGS